MSQTGKRGAAINHGSRVDAKEALDFAIAHHLRVEAPQVARPIALRLRMHATSDELSADAKLLFQQVSRLLG